MAVKARNNSAAPSFVDGYFRALSSQSILDVFVVQGLILPADAAKISAKYQNNLAIERFLLSNNLISREAINKAYSIILKLPFVSLTKLQIPKEALNVIPEKTAKKFNIVPFGVKANNIQIAVGNPGDIFLVQNRNFDAIEIQGGLKLEFFISTPEDVSKAIEQYSQKSSEILLSKTSVPVIFLRNRDIPIKYLKMLPVDFVKKNRVVIFDHVSDKIYRIAEETYDDSKTKKIIEFLKKNNGIELEEFSTSKEDIDYLVQIYENTLAKEAKVASNENVIENKEELSQKPDIKEHLKGMDVGDLEDEQPSITISEIKSKDGGKSEKVDLKSLVSEDDIQKGDTNTLNNVQSDIEKKQANGDDKVLSQESQGVESQELEDDKAMEVKHELDQIRKKEEDEKNIGKLLGGKEIKSKAELEEIAKDNSVPKLVAAIISYSLSMHSSDIHLEPEAKKLRVRFRVDGILQDIIDLPVEIHAAMTSRVKILGVMKLDETRIPQDGRFSVNFADREVDVRVSMIPTVYGEKTVMRILDKSQGILSLEDLGFVGSAFKIVMEEIDQPYGIIMATGPTGSGKSTTLYAILNRINKPGVNVITLEDPVEYEVPGVNQCQIRPKIGFTFAEGLRSVLRQDPNIIMVGEIRDADTASMATHAALTGHLVLTTLHTNDAASALPRLTNMGVEPFLITSSINLVIAQRLVRRICVKCREEVEVPPALKTKIEEELKNLNPDDAPRYKGKIQFYRGKGCPECTDGFKGRVGLYELMRMNDEIENLAVQRKPASEINDAAVRNGMLTMRQDGILKALEGLTTIDEIFLATGEIFKDDSMSQGGRGVEQAIAGETNAILPEDEKKEKDITTEDPNVGQVKENEEV